MKFKAVIVSSLALALAIAPFSSASARGYHHGSGGHDFGIFALGAVLGVGTAALLAAPYETAEPAPRQVYYAPPPQEYYAEEPVYYARPRVEYVQRYDYEPVYYAPRHGYYR